MQMWAAGGQSMIMGCMPSSSGLKITDTNIQVCKKASMVPPVPPAHIIIWSTNVVN